MQPAKHKTKLNAIKPAENTNTNNLFGSIPLARSSANFFPQLVPAMMLPTNVDRTTISSASKSPARSEINAGVNSTSQNFGQFILGASKG